MRSNYYADDLEHDIVGSVPHDVYYLAPRSVDPNSLYIQVNRAGIVLKTPRDFLISGDDVIVGSQRDSELRAYRLDRRTGRLADAGWRAAVVSPVCLVPLGEKV